MDSVQTSDSDVDPAFVADRQLFWHRFTNFTKGGIAAVVILLLVLVLFVY